MGRHIGGAILAVLLLACSVEAEPVPSLRPTPAHEDVPPESSRLGQTAELERGGYPPPPTELPPGYSLRAAAGAEVQRVLSLVQARNGVPPTVRASQRMDGPTGSAMYVLYDHGALEACEHALAGDPGARATCRADVGTGPNGRISPRLLRCRDFGLVRAVLGTDGAVAIEAHVRVTNVGCDGVRVHAFVLAELDEDGRPELRLDLETREPRWRAGIREGDLVSSEDGETTRRTLHVYDEDLDLELALDLRAQQLARNAVDEPNRVGRRAAFRYLYIGDLPGVQIEEIEYTADARECTPAADGYPAVRMTEESEGGTCAGVPRGRWLAYDPAGDRWRDR